MKPWKRFLADLPLLVLSPILLAFAAAVLWLADLFHLLFGRKTPVSHTRPSKASASVVIPNWNGRDLLAQYLPPLIEAMAGHPDNEIIVVDNGSTDGSVDYVRTQFPAVRVLALDRNLGFGAGSNAGFRAARNDIVVLLNNDMRVEQGFLAPLLEGFTDEKVFAVSCQIFFSDPSRVREETGLTQGWWESGSLRVRHRIDDAVTSLFPCFYGGGGSCAFDRRKFLELGGFDPLLSPFYLEDTDLGYQAWKRGWKVLYQPASVVYHEHRGTIGKHFSESQIQAVLKKNFLLFCWKNIHQPGWLASHFFFAFSGAWLSAMFGDSPERTNARGILRAFLQLPAAVRSRLRARSLAQINDREAFRRPLGGYFRDRFAELPEKPERLSVLFVSPYPIYPPVHGGGVFMFQTLEHLVELADVHLVALLDYPHQRELHEPLSRKCASAEFMVRLSGKTAALGSIVPHAVREFQNPDLEWLLHRKIYLDRVDVVQLEYLPMAQYAGQFERIGCILFEHDVYFQSIARQISSMPFWRRISAGFEYLRALRWELKILPLMDRIQVCSAANRDLLLSFLPELRARLDDDLRAGIDVSRYDFRPSGREPFTMLFLGSFRHTPNATALAWFATQVLPRVLERCPAARLVVVGSDPPPRHFFPRHLESIELRGFVEDIREPLSRYAIFVCPILAGSGMRVKLLEAFAAGIPVVSTTLGAEGLASRDGEVCALADTPEDFARRILDLFEDPDAAAAMAARARDAVLQRDMGAMTRRLADSYRRLVEEKRARLVR
jgi:GT2 family glycosyltransferase/glycosyltransferase involved in cell wall biosynthesis